MQPGSLSDERLRSLAKEIRDGITDIETDWLEWKSALDLATPGGRFRVSKQILGIANRVPGLARRNCGGHGYILVGVEQGAMPGTAQYDPAQLHDGINPYIGATGPAWRPRYIQVDNTTILAIEVDPPRPGDSIHTLKKSHEKFDRGTVFVRKDGKTHPAEPEDIENLEQRVQGAQLDLDLDLVGDLPISWFDEQALIATIKQVADSEREAQLHHARQTQEAGPLAEAYADISRTMALVLGGPDDRTIEQYAEEVTQWHSQWTERAPEHWMSAYAAAGHGMCSLSLANLTDHNFTSVEVCLEMPGARVITDLDEIETNLPKMPSPFGQRRRPSDIAGLDRLSMLRVAGLDYAPTLWVDNDDDGAFVTWDVGDVRPEQTLHTDPVCVLVGEAPSTRHLSVRWSATSTSVSGVKRGSIHLPLSDGPVLLDSIEHDLGLS
ncbi:MAG: ATP-binding protein [Acidimicrobiaceae bacterium]|nr:ATP-binding protein [Acidimicrobiaceae bacterium]